MRKSWNQSPEDTKEGLYSFSFVLVILVFKRLGITSHNKILEILFGLFLN